MYFIPQKNKWYSSIVHMSTWYRYAALIIISSLLFFGWRYGLYVWLDMMIHQEQAAIAHMQQQLAQQSLTQCQCADLSNQLPILRQVLAQSTTQCIGGSCSDQCSYIFEEVHKAGLHMHGYQTEKSTRNNDWKQSQYIALMLNGSLDQVQTFLAALKKSSRMVQCTSISLQRAEENNFAIQCTIQFIVPQLNA
jgi:hypothetical protein